MFISDDAHVCRYGKIGGCDEKQQEIDQSDSGCDSVYDADGNASYPGHESQWRHQGIGADFRSVLIP